MPYNRQTTRVVSDNRHRNVSDPTATAAARKKLADEITAYLDAKSGCKKTVSAHRLVLTEFQAWATQQNQITVAKNHNPHTIDSPGNSWPGNWEASLLTIYTISGFACWNRSVNEKSACVAHSR
jgi:hypothetical protein